jgi:hypothetical protein
LYAVVNHVGSEPDNGHDTANIEHAQNNNVWNKFNNEEITVEKKPIFSKCVYFINKFNKNFAF